MKEYNIGLSHIEGTLLSIGTEKAWLGYTRYKHIMYINGRSVFYKCVDYPSQERFVKDFLRYIGAK